MKHGIRVISLAVVGSIVFLLLGVQVEGATPDEVKLIAQVTYAEANNQCEEGKRLVIDTILNRLDDNRFPNTISGVIKQPNQYACSRKKTTDEITKLVLEELETRTNNQVLWFRTKRYHKYGTPIVKVGDHYFSGNEVEKIEKEGE